MLNELGFSGEKYTEKSFKNAGVTSATNAGLSLEQIAFHGRWLSSETPRHYRVMADEYRVKIAAQIPLR